jgi:osmotically-inducible protein OsmY
MKTFVSALSLALGIATASIAVTCVPAQAADAVAARVDDDITKDVQAAIAAEPTLKDQHIDVSTKAGEVTLVGTVTDQQLMVTAGHAAEKIQGVKYVLNNIAPEDYLKEHPAK